MSMSVGEVEEAVESPPQSTPTGKDIEGRSPWQLARRRFRHDKVSMVALVVLVLVVVVGIGAPIMQKLHKIDPYAFHRKLVGGIGSMPTGGFGGMSSKHLLGVEPGTGRDVLSRLVLAITFS